MSWDYIVSKGIDLHVVDRIDAASAARQKKTANHILERLAEQPGVILADEVGMGKTFVALSVGVSISLVNPDAGPVVVMVPPSVKDKWPRDFGVFFERCLKPAARERIRATPHTLEHGIDLLKALDDPPERQQQLLFMTHGALSRGLTDPWVKLALVKHVLAARRMGDVRTSFPRFAGRLLGRKNIDDDVWDRLLGAPPARWGKLLEEAGVTLDDDPVPDALVKGVDDLSRESITSIADALQDLPKRESPNSEERVLEARRKLTTAFQDVWREWLAASCRRVRLPLLILDEAHHLKNADTKLASMFRTPESAEDASMLAGELNGVFERMLFLTATPFQLGHGELMNVLTRFASIAWTSDHAPSRTKEQFQTDVDALRDALDASQREALGLDRAWGRLRPEHIVDGAGAPLDPDDWWRSLVESAAPAEGLTGDVLARFQATDAAMRVAEERLKPWVIRHMKPRKLGVIDDSTTTTGTTDRRTVWTGAAITDTQRRGGLEIGSEALLPFLLAARATATIAETKAGRALFAEGLASSFEAYRDTRAQHETREGTRDEEEHHDAPDAPSTKETDWYLRAIEDALPRDRDDAAASHPKVRATTRRVLELWKNGEKTLVFCHYRATGKALERHISRAIDEEMTALAAKRFGCTPEEATQRLAHLAERFNRLDDALRREIDERLDALVRGADTLADDERAKIVEVMRRFFRTPAFLSRFFPADADATTTPIAVALEQRDASGLMLRDRLEGFCRFLALRCTPRERTEYLEALSSLQTGERYGREDLDGSGGADHAKLLPNVRLANGATKDDTRRRLLLAFNTPFFPEVLVASSVLAEGVDLHLDCRFVIHHDLCWNPSTLEQRTGRVDRLGAKADRAGQSINIYLPYVAATQDEKMFRVVSDRERWFQVVMGEKFAVDEGATEKQAERVPLPRTLADALSLKLGV